MRRVLALAAAGVLLALACWSLTDVGAAPIGDKAAADGLVAEQVRHLNSLADALEKQDAEGVQKATALLLQTRTKLTALKLADDDKTKLADKYGEALSRANARAGAALGNLDLGLNDLIGGLRGEAEIKELLKIQREAQEAARKDPAKALEYLPKMVAVTKKLEDLRLTSTEERQLRAKYKAEFDEIEQRQRRFDREREKEFDKKEGKKDFDKKDDKK
jgi:hypothetical protein